jgi:hypothetical protein
MEGDFMIDYRKESKDEWDSLETEIFQKLGKFNGDKNDIGEVRNDLEKIKKLQEQRRREIENNKKENNTAREKDDSKRGDGEKNRNSVERGPVIV